MGALQENRTPTGMAAEGLAHRLSTSPRPANRRRNVQFGIRLSPTISAISPPSRSSPRGRRPTEWIETGTGCISTRRCDRLCRQVGSGRFGVLCELAQNWPTGTPLKDELIRCTAFPEEPGLLRGSWPTRRATTRISGRRAAIRPRSTATAPAARPNPERPAAE